MEKTVFVFSDSSKIEFTGSKVTGSHDGGFSNFVGKFEVAGDALAPRGRHSVIIDMNSIYTDNEKLTEHLKSEDFFHVEDFPMARFDLDEAVAKGDDLYELSGTLDLHGVAKKITFPATVNVGEAANLVDFDAEFAINRKDFNIVYPGKPDDLIRDEVVMKLTVSAVRRICKLESMVRLQLLKSPKSVVRAVPAMVGEKGAAKEVVLTGGICLKRSGPRQDRNFFRGSIPTTMATLVRTKSMSGCGDLSVRPIKTATTR